MDESYDADDERLEQRQGAGLYPLGRALRSTYDADNHATLSAEVTALMIDLSRVPYEPCTRTPVVAAMPDAPVRSLRARVLTFLGR